MWLVIRGQTNYIPKESSIFFFNPIKIDDGSGGYWRYGEDLNKLYYFSEEEYKVYYSQPKENSCQNLNKTDISTWCNSTKHHQAN